MHDPNWGRTFAHILPSLQPSPYILGGQAGAGVQPQIPGTASNPLPPPTTRAGSRLGMHQPDMPRVLPSGARTSLVPNPTFQQRLGGTIPAPRHAGATASPARMQPQPLVLNQNWVRPGVGPFYAPRYTPATQEPVLSSVPGGLVPQPGQQPHWPWA